MTTELEVLCVPGPASFGWETIECVSPHASRSKRGVRMHVRELQWIEPVAAMRCLAHRAHLRFSIARLGMSCSGATRTGMRPVQQLHRRGRTGELRWKPVEGDPSGTLVTFSRSINRNIVRISTVPGRGGRLPCLRSKQNIERLAVPDDPGQRLPNRSCISMMSSSASTIATIDVGSSQRMAEQVPHVAPNAHAVEPMNRGNAGRCPKLPPNDFPA